MKLKPNLKPFILGSLLSLTSFIATAQEPGKANLKEVTQNLDMDGQFFMVNNIEGDLPKIAKLANDWIQTAVKNGNEKVPSDLDAEKMLRELGLDQIFAYGRSAKHAGDHWVNKMYLQTGGSDKGLLSILGNQANPFAVPQFAPTGSDLAIEMNMDMRQVDDMIKLMKDLPQCPKSKKMLEGLTRKLPTGITGEELLNQLNMKMSIAVKLDDNKRVECPIYPEYTFPEMHTCIRLEGADILWKQISPMAGFMMKSEKQEDGTLLMTPHKTPKKGFMKGKKPVIVIDEANNQIWIASSPEFLAKCRGDGAKLSADEQFKAISEGVTAGNMLAYISKQTCMEIRQVKEAKYKKSEKNCLSDDMLKKVMDHVTESKNGYIMMVQKGATGTDITLKAPCPLKEMICGSRKRGCRWSKGKKHRNYGKKKEHKEHKHDDDDHDKNDGHTDDD